MSGGYTSSAGHINIIYAKPGETLHITDLKKDANMNNIAFVGYSVYLYSLRKWGKLRKLATDKQPAIRTSL